MQYSNRVYLFSLNNSPPQPPRHIPLHALVLEDIRCQTARENAALVLPSQHVESREAAGVLALLEQFALLVSVRRYRVVVVVTIRSSWIHNRHPVCLGVVVANVARRRADGREAAEGAVQGEVPFALVDAVHAVEGARVGVLGADLLLLLLLVGLLGGVGGFFVDGRSRRRGGGCCEGCSDFVTCGVVDGILVPRRYLRLGSWLVVRGLQGVLA